MKLRLPILLISAFSLAGSVVHADPVIRDEEQLKDTETIIVDTIFTKSVWLYNSGSFTTTIGGGDSSPVVEMLAVKPAWNSHLNVESGILKLKKEGFDWWGPKEYSMWIAYDYTRGGSSAEVNVRGTGKIEAESKIWLGQAPRAEGDRNSAERASLNIYGGEVKALGINSPCQANAENPGHSVNLLGGRLILGSGGMMAEYHNITAEFPYIYRVNLYSGVLGSYESWSSTRDVTLFLDSPDAVLPDGTKSDGNGSVTIAPVKDTTITINSKIEGTGTGELIKSGEGALYIKGSSAINDFSQKFVLTEGTLQADYSTTIGKTNTVVVRNAGLGNAAAFEVPGLSGVSNGLGGWRTTLLNFDILEGSEFVFKAALNNPTNILEFTDSIVTGQGSIEFESSVVFDGKKELEAGISNFMLGSKGKVEAKDTFYLSQNTTASISGTFTVSKGRAEDGSIQTGLGIGAYHGSMWTTSKMKIEDGGILEVKDSKVILSEAKESGQLIINAGGKADIWGVEETGAWAQIAINGGTLKIGAGGIHFNDWSGQDDQSGKTGDTYLGNVYFSSGKLEITEDSFYRYTGATEFAEIVKDGVVTRPASIYTGHFILGKDSTGALEEGESRREISVGEGASFTFEANILGDGGFNKTGGGTVNLQTANGYKGNTVVEEGTLQVGDDQSLGTNGKLSLLSGSTFAATGKSVTIANNVEMGTSADSDYNVTLGRAGQTEILTLGGKVDIQATTATLNVQSETKIGGDFTGHETTTLNKTGEGSLTIDKTLTGVQTLDIKKGKIVFGTESALAKAPLLKVGNGATLDLGDYTATTGTTTDLAGGGTLNGTSKYKGTLRLGTAGEREVADAPWKGTANGNLKAGILEMNVQNARLTVTGGELSVEKSVFTLGSLNTMASKDKALITADKAEITGTERGSLTLNFDAKYLDTLINQGGTYQLFSNGVEYSYGIIQNNQKQYISIDTTRLGTEGIISCFGLKMEGILIDQKDADAMTETGKYTPDNEMTYLGAKAGEIVTIGSDVVYELDHGADNYTYKFTPGQGSLIYSGKLTGKEDSLYVIDYAEITKKPEDNSKGYVAISNNGNDYAGGTDISGSKLIVDLSLDKSQALNGQDGNLQVNALGTSHVEIKPGMTMKGTGELILRAYGNELAEGINRYTYANDFSLSGGAILAQEGANDQILTGDITSMGGSNTLTNRSAKTLTLKGRLIHQGSETLTLHNQEIGGRIQLDGSESKADGKNRQLDAENLLVSGKGTVTVANGYTVQIKGAVINEGTLQLKEEGTLTIGQKGLAGTGRLLLNGGTLKSASSWTSETTIEVGLGTNTVNTGGANVRLTRGITGEGGFIKQGTGYLYLNSAAEGNARGPIVVRQGRLALRGTNPGEARMAGNPADEYTLSGPLVLESGKGASLEGMINAAGNDVTFGNGTRFYLGVSETDGLTGYIRDAGKLTIGTGTQLHIDVLQDNWTTSQTYTVFSGREDIMGGGNLELALETEFEFVDVNLDLSNSKEIGLYLTKKGSTPGGGSGLTGVGENAGAIHTVVAPLAAGVLDDSVELTGKLKQHMQKVSKMTTTEYKTYLTDMGNSASSFYTALSAQVQDATQHINSVRNRVELINPVMYDDWTQGGIYNVWAGGINHYRDVKSGSEAPGYEMTSWGGELGCAIPLSQTFMIGVGFAYTFSDVQVKDGWGSNDNDTYNVDFFARYRSEGWTITGVLTGGFTNTEFHRNQILKDEVLRANSSTDGNQFLGTLEVGYDFYLNEEKSWILQPLANITAGRAKLDSLSETGEMKNAGLMIGSQSYNMFSAGVGAKIAYQYQNSVSDQPGRVELKAMYVNDMGDVDFEVNGRFIGAPGKGFDLKGVSNERSAAIVSAGWIAPISAYGQFFVDAGCEFRKDQNGVNTTVGFSFQF